MENVKAFAEITDFEIEELRDAQKVLHSTQAMLLAAPVREQIFRKSLRQFS